MLILTDAQEIDEGDQAILDSYMPQGQLAPGRTLADLIMEKIDQQDEGQQEVVGTFAFHHFSLVSHQPSNARCFMTSTTRG